MESYFQLGRTMDTRYPVRASPALRARMRTHASLQSRPYLFDDYGSSHLFFLFSLLFCFLLCVCVFFFVFTIRLAGIAGGFSEPGASNLSRCLDSGIALDASDALLSPSSFGEERLCPLRVFSITLCSAENTQKDTFAFA